MTPSKNENGARYVTYPYLWTTVITIVILLSGLNGFLLAQHSSQTHKGTVTEKEFEQLQKRLDERYRTILSTLEFIQRKLK